MNDRYKHDHLNTPVLELRDLSIAVVKRGKQLKTLVKHLHLTVQPGEMVGLAGESGSGKSVTVSAIAGLLPNDLQVAGGQIYFRGKNLNQLANHERRSLLGKEISFVFQDHHSSLTPFIKIGLQMIETIQTHQKQSAKEARELALTALEAVKLPAQRIFDSFPFQLSGGQRQRVGIALAMMLRPALIIADEPTAALDVVTGRQILDLLAKLQQETKCAVLLISHDLTQVLERTHRIAIIYGGQIMEEGPTKAIEHHARHPYSQLLMRARPSLLHQPGRLFTIPGEPGLVAEKGCPFALRCPLKITQCIEPPTMRTLSLQHKSSCHHLTAHEGEHVS